MRSKLLFLLTVTLAVGQLFAGPVDLTKATKACAGFAQTALSSTMRSDAVSLVKATSDYYVFNIGTKGFVIVSADDRFRPIVGYSYEGCFPTENPSPEMQYYLDNLSQGRQVALRTDFPADPEVAEEWALLLSGNPLPSRNGGRASFYLLTTRWNQNSPYNKFCPGNSYAGCVATAMSQVMNYWSHPTHGWGHHSYTHRVWGELSADFSQARYDFDLMPNSIAQESPVEQIDAIATFMYHCGIAVDMDYSTDGSGAYSEDVPEAVLKYFGYSNRMRLVSRNAHTLAEFQAILKDQFDMGWPCYYSGSDTNGNGGHAFVCDGYDDNDMFHFNWGWSGTGNGFYAIDELNVSSYAFNSGQDAIINYVPTEVFENTAKAPDSFTAVPVGDDDFSVTLSWINPTATLDGKPLEAIDQIVVTRDGVEVATFDNPTPGASMTQVIPTGLPAMVSFKVYAVCNGYPGRKASVNGINLGPVCNWKVRCYTEDQVTSQGMLTIYNPAFAKLGDFIPQAPDRTYEVEIPQGRITMNWTAPSDSIHLEISILDADDQPVFVYEGPSGDMPSGIFYEMVNTCGGSGSLLHPTELTAQVVDDNVLLQWKGIPDPGYGYNIYRDGALYTMVADVTEYLDVTAALKMHTYFVTAFCKEGETDPSNTCCAVLETPEICPRNFDGEMVSGNKITLSWDLPENPEGIGAIAIYSKNPGEEYKRIKMLEGTDTKYTLRYQYMGQKYNFMLKALYGNDGEIESSPARTLSHPDRYYLEINATHLPSGLVLQQQEEGMVLLQWDPALNAEYYNLYRNGERYLEGLTETQATDKVTEEDGILVYQVTGVVNGVESSPSNKAWWGNVAVDEMETEGLSVYPNPTQGVVLVVAEGLREIEIYSVTGQQLLHRQTNMETASIDLSSHGPGIYYLRAQTDKGTFVRKVILMQ